MTLSSVFLLEILNIRDVPVLQESPHRLSVAPDNLEPLFNVIVAIPDSGRESGLVERAS